MAATRIAEPRLVSLPKPSIPRVKMLGNMMELKKPTAKMLHIATWPALIIEVTVSKAAAIAATPNTLRVAMR